MITYLPHGRLGNYCWELMAIFDYVKRFGYTEKDIVIPGFMFLDKHIHTVSYYKDFFKNIRECIIDDEIVFNQMTKDNPKEKFKFNQDFGNNITFIKFSSDLTHAINQKDSQLLYRKLFRNEELFLNLYNKYSSLFDNTYTLAVHVRRMDYIKAFPNYRYLNSDNIIMDIKNRLSELKDIPRVKIVIFSDDINWCKEVLSKSDIEQSMFFYIVNNKDYEDLVLMALCDEILRSGSSFSCIAKNLKI